MIKFTCNVSLVCQSFESYMLKFRGVLHEEKENKIEKMIKTAQQCSSNHLF